MPKLSSPLGVTQLSHNATLERTSLSCEAAIRALCAHRQTTSPLMSPCPIGWPDLGAVDLSNVLLHFYFH